MRANRYRRAAWKATAGVVAAVALAGVLLAPSYADDGPTVPSPPPATTAIGDPPLIPTEGVPTTPTLPPKLPNHQVKIKIPKHLASLGKLFRDLPPLDPTVAEQQIQATVQLMARPKNSPPDTPFELLESGVLTKEGPTLEVMTAGHGLADVTGAFAGSIFSSDPAIKAFNYDSRARMEYAVADPTSPAWYRRTHPIANVLQLNVAADGTDMAALVIADSKVAQTRGRTLDQIAPLEYRLVHKAPRLGDPVSLNGVPVAHAEKPLAAEGVYLTRETYYPFYSDGNVHVTPTDGAAPITPPLQRDVVAVEARVASEDPCNFGASGELIRTDSGAMLGVLSARNNIGYGAKKRMQNIEHLGRQLNIGDRLRLEASLKVDLSSDRYTICYVAVPKRDTMLALQHAWPVPPVPTPGA